MPHTTDRLPFEGATPGSRQASYSGAEAAAPTREQKRRVYLAFVTARGGVSDEEAERALKFRRSSICSIRNGLVTDGEIVQDGTRVIPPRGQTKRVTHALWRRTTATEKAWILRRQQQLKEAAMTDENRDDTTATEEQRPIDQGDGAEGHAPAAAADEPTSGDEPRG